MMALGGPGWLGLRDSPQAGAHHGRAQQAYGSPRKQYGSPYQKMGLRVSLLRRDVHGASIATPPPSPNPLLSGSVVGQGRTCTAIRPSGRSPQSLPQSDGRPGRTGLVR